MKFFRQYCLHDTRFSNCILNNEGVEFLFNDGIYLFENEKETNLSSSCKLSITINNFNVNNVQQNIEIIKFAKGKYSEIDLQELEALLKTNCFQIDMCYFSSFDSSILIKGFVEKNKFDMIINDVDKIYVDYLN